jgi:hypothetical protein
MDQHWICPDDCMRYLKNDHVFQWLCMLHKKIKLPHIWNYFESWNGKQDHDGAG